ncbi:MAG TPA: hypothetical protein P5569_12195, partial [Candidatus Latescibacteria bacterium]|nr:hypothetical protein [Candidatus Latescibacterota bacterium]
MAKVSSMGHSKAMVLSHDAEWRWHVRADMPPPRVGEVTHLLKPHGECVLTILTSQQSVWLHTKDFYPAGCYRLPTGGIKPEEHPDEAARQLVERLVRYSQFRNAADALGEAWQAHSGRLYRSVPVPTELLRRRLPEASLRAVTLAEALAPLLRDPPAPDTS